MSLLNWAQLIGPALVAGLMILAIHVPLGFEVLKRRIVFMDLAVAQLAGVGLMLGSSLISDHNSLWLQFCAFALAFGGGLFFLWIERVMPDQQEAVIGCSYVLAASVMAVMVARLPEGAELAQQLLSGQLLFVAWQDLLAHLPVYLLVGVLWFSVPKVRSGLWFYLLFALAITSSVQLAGVYVVFATLILPALGALRASRPYLMAYLLGICSVLGGLLVSLLSDWPTGPVLVISFCAVSFAAASLYGLKARKVP